MPLLSVNHLTLGYEGKKVLEDISFAVNTGDYLCITGENGSGKSTLMKTILGLLPPLGGAVVFSDGLQKNQIGYLPQQTQLQKNFPASVGEIVLSGCLNQRGLRPFYQKREKALAKENMERLGITSLSQKSYQTLSGGQQQRVLLARALCATQKLLLLDEPVAGLDPQATQDLYDIIARLNTQEGLTVIMILHDMPAARAYASHLLHLDNGHFIYSAAKEYILPKIAALPFTREVF